MGCGASAQVQPRQLVLLGGGECGKTTIFKQIQLLHGSGFSDDVRSDWVSAVSASPLRAMKVLITRADELNIEVDKTKKEAIMGPYQTLNQLSPEAAATMKAVYESAEIQRLVEKHKESTHKDDKLDLDDNALYFLGKMDEMGKPGFLPSTDDILKVRDPTRTIETLDFQAGKAKFRVIDVGGQRMERPKWNLTGEITAVVFVCALTEYDQTLREDVKQNRLKESLNLFDIACNRRYPDKPILLFLNKKDLFEEKIKRIDLNVCFPTYKGGRDYDAALEYIKWKFMNVRKDKNKQIYVMETTATDTKNMKFIVQSMIDIVEKQNLAQSGFG